ncbi:MAG: tRNA uridine-5-carboxymethylaminomethyl(34) synthesis GTPase MnmE [Calditrichia bacterium]
MKRTFTEDTIVALSSPAGKGAIALIRMSGPKAISIINRLFSGKINSGANRRAFFGQISDPSGEKIDDVIVTYFKKPASYTGEDVVEISCHGNNIIINDILESLISAGCRPANPGEFTERAFLNGKLDLSQAEAVAKLIDAQSRKGLQLAQRQLSGRLSGKIHQLKDELIKLAGLLEISLDFSEEDIEIYDSQHIVELGRNILTGIEKLISTFKLGNLLQNGVSVALLGKPNVGKSSLLNQLLQKERAIVSHIPGTTRDYIEDRLELEGILFRIIDTAGIRSTDDTIEEVGVQRSLEQSRQADLLIALFDSSQELDKDDQRLIAHLKTLERDTAIISVLNKRDLPGAGIQSELETVLHRTPVSISAKSGEGIEDLKQAMVSAATGGQQMEEYDALISNQRHLQALKRAAADLKTFIQNAEHTADETILAEDLRSAIDHLGEITGETTADDILNTIFSNFCIGK